jgi:hypothetical protein
MLSRKNDENIKGILAKDSSSEEVWKARMIDKLKSLVIIEGRLFEVYYCNYYLMEI